MDDRDSALLRLGQSLRDVGYRFVTVSPETHRRVDARATAAGCATATSLRDVFGWSRAFAPGLLPAPMMELARAAGILKAEGALLLRSTVRFSSYGEDIFVHSAYPTTAEDAVFFGPDTYRFCNLVAARLGGASRVVDVGCGSGATGILAAKSGARAVLADVNHRALAFAAVNAALAGVEARVETIESDVLGGTKGPIDLVIANPPYMVDRGAERTYRDGGGAFGEALAVRIVREALSRLEPGGRLVLYTGSAIVNGIDTFLDAVRPLCVATHATWRYGELDPDVFGEEIETNDAYASVERIAAVALTATVP